jgi:hypothetical protein
MAVAYPRPRVFNISSLVLTITVTITIYVANATTAAQNNAYRILVGKPEGKRPLGRSRRRWVDNIKMDLREIGWDGMDWIDLAQDRDNRRALVNTVMKLRVP